MSPLNRKHKSTLNRHPWVHRQRDLEKQAVRIRWNRTKQAKTEGVTTERESPPVERGHLVTVEGEVYQHGSQKMIICSFLSIKSDLSVLEHSADQRTILGLKIQLWTRVAGLQDTNHRAHLIDQSSFQSLLTRKDISWEGRRVILQLVASGLLDIINKLSMGPLAQFF